MQKGPCNKSTNHRYEELSISETRRQILKESRHSHGGQRQSQRSEITIPIEKAKTEKNGLSRQGETRLNNISGGAEKSTKDGSQQNGTSKMLMAMIPKGVENSAHKEC